MSSPVGPLLVLGIGNVLLRDDGVGVHVLRELERRAECGDVALPRDTRLIDGGTLGLDLLPLLAGSRALLLLDAVDLGLAPGSVAVLHGDALRAGARVTRAVLPAGVGDLLAAARLAGVLPAAIALVGVQAGEIAAGLALTADVRAALPAAIARAIDELGRLDPGAAAGLRPMGPGHDVAGFAA